MTALAHRVGPVARSLVALLLLAFVPGPALPAVARAPSTTPKAGSGGDAPAPALAGEQRLRYGAFKNVTVYRPHGAATSVAIFVSGDGGWNLGVVDMARHLIDMDALVVGIDIRDYLKAVNAPTSSCHSFAADFEGLAHEVERRFKLPQYLPPILVGYSSGATLVYATIVQSPKGTFDGAMSLGFCPDLAMTQKICKGSGLNYDIDYGKSTSPRIAKGVLLKEAEHNVTPWVAFQGELDQVCDPPATRAFVQRTGKGELVWLAKVGHGFSVERNWLPQFRDAYRKLAEHAIPPPLTLPEVRDLPLVEVPATATASASADEDVFAVLLTGDGGWAGLDQDVAAALAARGVPVVGKRSHVLLVGYSFGADVLPFLYTRLPPDVRAQVSTVSLLGLSDSASFEFHVSDWIPGSADDGRPTKAEIARMTGATVLCLYGKDEADSPCPSLDSPGVKSVALSGGHHFDGDYGALAQAILAHSRR